VNSRMVFRTAALAAACLLSTASAWAQAAPTSGAAAAGKVGVISIRQAIVATAEGKQASAELQSQFAPRQTEIENMNKQINDVRQRLAACEGKCSQDEIARLTTQGQRAAAQLERKQNEYQEDVNAAQGRWLTFSTATPARTVTPSSWIRRRRTRRYSTRRRKSTLRRTSSAFSILPIRSKPPLQRSKSPLRQNRLRLSRPRPSRSNNHFDWRSF